MQRKGSHRGFIKPAQQAFFLWLALLTWALWMSGLGRVPVVNWDGLPLVAQFFGAMARPALEATFLQLIAEATVVTLAFAVCGTTLSVVLGLVAGIACSRMWWQVCWPGRGGKWLWLGLRGLLAVPRAIHELIWGLLLLTIFGLDPLVGVLAIAIPFGAITAKVFSEILDETPPEPLTALVCSGVHPAVAFLYALLPQALPNLISYSFYRFECSLRSAAVLGIIGAGGLGQEIWISLQSLRYEQLWTGFYALVLLNGTVDFCSGWLRRKMGFVSRLELSQKVTPQNPQLGPQASLQTSASSTERWGIRCAWLIIALSIPLCFAYLNLDWQRLGGGMAAFKDIARQIAPAKVLPQFSLSLLPIALQTVAMSVLAITLAGLFGTAFSFPAAQNFFLPGGLIHPARASQQVSIGHVGMVCARLLLLFARAIPAPIFALVILYGMFPSILPGALALAIHNFGILGRLMAEVNENLPDGPVRGLRSLGASGIALIFYGILPANLSRFLAYSLYRWEVCLRETVIVGLVGAGGLGRLLTEQLSSFDYSALAATLTVFILLTIGIDLISGWMRSAVR